MPSIEAVCFDLDDTLCISEQDDAEIHQRIFERVGTEPFFTPEDVYAVDADTLPQAETDREFYESLYHAAAERTGTSPDSQIVAALAEATVDVGDWHGGDIVGAHAAGLQSVWVPHEVDTIPAEPDPEPTHRLDSMAELPDLL